MLDFFVAGGWGMYPTLLGGLGLLAASFQYARRPEKRYVPLMVALGLFTLIAGGLGFITGFMVCLHAYAEMEAARNPTLLAFGLQEALHNIVLALLLGMGAALLASVGAWRCGWEGTGGSGGDGACLPGHGV
ncbi:hypothetical protein [Stigmatella erecta]|uniref:MotA/TolQ/ExbB proton channel family protein n=1 Tax=Stigmatella erecta TaxID=83460 RepID=A0A1I0I7I5_9BACT|nr:hypothetical protein [Stigmatella erecta]SET92480.1 hypothetical protein SAMN05443639_105344 [Stigmatella erecta]